MLDNLRILRHDVILSLKNLQRKNEDHTVAEECAGLLGILEIEGLEDSVYLNIIWQAWGMCSAY